MKERPILFSAEMVRAILGGRKTQTRRVIKDPHGLLKNYTPTGKTVDYGYGTRCGVKFSDTTMTIPCPYGQPGDRLWVREAFGLDFDDAILYRACKYGSKPFDPGQEIRWKPPIHMPRVASRIDLEITEVRVERLQDISEADALAEGCEEGPDDDVTGGSTAYQEFAKLWCKIKGADSWVANPWVWAISFKRIKP